MGFGQELLIALKHVADDMQRGDSQSLSALVVSSHPPVRQRIGQLESLLRTEDPFR